MYRGDRARKTTLVEYGFRLPSALDNRPLKFEEVEAYWDQVIFVSATPGKYEIEEKGGGQIVEQIIRPTGLIDPQINVHPVQGQIDHLIGKIHERVKQKQRVLVTTLTKRMAEDLSEYLIEAGIRANYMHSEIDVFDRAVFYDNSAKVNLMYLLVSTCYVKDLISQRSLLLQFWMLTVPVFLGL